VSYASPALLVSVLVANCTGKASFKDADGAKTLLWNFVILHGGQEIETFALRPARQSRPMYSLTFTQKKR
jgi:hypothetical protein